MKCVSRDGSSSSFLFPSLSNVVVFLNVVWKVKLVKSFINILVK